MKLAYGSVPVKALNINYFEQDTNDCDMIASDLQAGKTAVARGKKIVGTGKSFEFARYGSVSTNVSTIIPTMINVVEITSLNYPVQSFIALNDMQDIDFSTSQTIGNIIVDGTPYPLTIVASDNTMTISCDKMIRLEIFYGKDNYV